MPHVTHPQLYAHAQELLRGLYGEGAVFRDGQYEAIEATLTHRRTLVVQRTGWGKSLVCFLSTKLLRAEGRGVTLVVSPLLVLMQNQLAAASGLGLRCEVLNSTVRDRLPAILDALKRGELDLVLVTPETLLRDPVQAALPDIRIGLFVVDEAHCISDWGFDFRLEYSRLRSVIGRLPPHVPLLATTATANDRVVEDLRAQFGEDVYVSRGSLTRESLYIQMLNLPHPAERYAWILDNLPRLPGSGIIYCLTQRDCDYLADFLCKGGIAARAYYSRNGEEGEAVNTAIEEEFRDNRIRVLVATVKLGMGYDKGDIAFVIHYQMPANIVSYYQQIGRAGRSIDRAYTFLMSGREDRRVLQYFIDTAFPHEEETDRIMELVQNANGLSLYQLEAALNIRPSRLKKALSFLEHDGFVVKASSRYYPTARPYVYNRAHYEAIRDIRLREMAQIEELTRTEQCYSRFTVRALDDYTAPACGLCPNCTGWALFPAVPTPASLEQAVSYIGGLVIPIKPRQRWATGVGMRPATIALGVEEGFCLAKYGDPGYGALVGRDKYTPPHRYRDELVGAAAGKLWDWVRTRGITHVTCVPSLRSGMVADFARRLAEALGLPFVELLEKTAAPQQKTMENSYHQCRNALDSFAVKEGALMPERVLLVDDMVDSRWTLTVCGYRLREAGCAEVYPFALADSSQREEGEP